MMAKTNAHHRLCTLQLLSLVLETTLRQIHDSQLSAVHSLFAL